MKKWLVVAGLVAIASAAPAHAAVIFSDNFDAENGGIGQLNFSSFTNFTVADGTVDLIGNGYFDFPPVTNGHGLYVDLDGSTNDAGIQSANAMLLGPGSYVLSFQLAGSQRGTNEIVWAKIYNTVPLPLGTNLVTDAYFRTSGQAFGNEFIHFNLAAATNIGFSFENAGAPGDNIGALLDNVQLESVPEPGSMMLMGTGLFGLAGVVRRRFRRA